DEAGPPARGGLVGPRLADDVRVAGQGVQHQDGVAAGLVQSPPGLEADAHVGQGPPALEREVAHDGRATSGRHRLIDRGRHLRIRDRAPLAATRPAARSARMSSMCSVPAATRARPGVTPGARWAASPGWGWVVAAGWMSRGPTSPMLATWECS